MPRRARTRHFHQLVAVALQDGQADLEEDLEEKRDHRRDLTAAMATGGQRALQISSATGALSWVPNLHAVEEETVQNAHGLWQLHRRDELREEPRQRRQRQLQVLVLPTLQHTERATDRVVQQAADMVSRRREGLYTWRRFQSTGMYFCTSRSNTFWSITAPTWTRHCVPHCGRNWLAPRCEHMTLTRAPPHHVGGVVAGQHALAHRRQHPKRLQQR